MATTSALHRLSHPALAMPHLRFHTKDMAMWLRRMAALVICCGSGLAAAAGINCDKATNSIDLAICHSQALPSLDAQMGRSYAEAAQRAGTEQDELLRDQRHWLAERNELIASLLEIPRASPKQDFVEQPLVRLYQDRISYLTHVFQSEPGTSPLLAAIAEKLSKSPDSDYPRDVWKSLGGDGSVFRVPTEERTDVKSIGSKIPVDPGSALTDVIDALDSGGETSMITLAMLPDVGIGGMYQIAGTLHCTNWSIFTWKNRSIQAMKTPKILEQNCWTTWGNLIMFQGKVGALTNGLALTGSSIQTQTLVNGNWSTPERLEVRYDYELQNPQGYCAKDNPDCAELISLASGYVTRYDRNRIPELVSETSLSKEEKLTFAAMQAAMKTGYGPLPTFDQADNGSYSDFGSGPTFPVRWHGELLLGKISRATLGWRVGDDWLIGLWHQPEQGLEPLVGVRVHVVRTNYLHSAIIP